MESDQKVQITTEVIDKDLPLLLSKQAMKNAKVSIDFENDTVEILEKEHQIQFSSTGHYCIPIQGIIQPKIGCDYRMLPFLKKNMRTDFLKKTLNLCLKQGR